MQPRDAQRILSRPRLLEGVGRLFGFGAGEQAELARGAFPTWAIVGLALGAGAVAGMYIQSRWRVI